MDPITGAALISGGSSILNNMMQGIGSRRQNKRMVDFWKMQNDYNHPTAQMQRLQEAGLNPNLIYGDSVSGATGRADSIGTPDKPQFDNPLEKFQNAKMQTAQYDNLRAVNTNLLKDAELKTLKMATELANSQLKGHQAELLKRTMDDMVMKINIDANNTLKRSYLDDFSSQQIEAIKQSKFLQLIGKDPMSLQKLSNEEKRGIMYDLENDLKGKNLDYYDSQAIVNMVARIMGIF